MLCGVLHCICVRKLLNLIVIAVVFLHKNKYNNNNKYPLTEYLYQRDREKDSEKKDFANWFCDCTKNVCNTHLSV